MSLASPQANARVLHSTRAASHATSAQSASQKATYRHGANRPPMLRQVLRLKGTVGTTRRSFGTTFGMKATSWSTPWTKRIPSMPGTSHERNTTARRAGSMPSAMVTTQKGSSAPSIEDIIYSIPRLILRFALRHLRHPREVPYGFGECQELRRTHVPLPQRGHVGGSDVTCSQVAIGTTFLHAITQEHLHLPRVGLQVLLQRHVHTRQQHQLRSQELQHTPQGAVLLHLVRQPNDRARRSPPLWLPAREATTHTRFGHDCWFTTNGGSYQ